MMATQPPFSGFHRKPLQPKNQYATTTTIRNLAPEISFSNKENVPPLYSSAPVKKEINKEIDDDDDALLADKLKTEKLLRERGAMLDSRMKEMVERGEIDQKQLELEVDRLYRLKEINLACMRVSRLRSLRDKEEEKKPHRQLNKAYICCTRGKHESFSSESV